MFTHKMKSVRCCLEWVADAGREVGLHLDNRFYTTVRGCFLKCGRVNKYHIDLITGC